jgi:hypothetical protein
MMLLLLLVSWNNTGYLLLILQGLPNLVTVKDVNTDAVFVACLMEEHMVFIFYHGFPKMFSVNC